MRILRLCILLNLVLALGARAESFSAPDIIPGSGGLCDDIIVESDRQSTMLAAGTFLDFGNGRDLIPVSRSTDGGVTWSTAVPVLAEGYTVFPRLKSNGAGTWIILFYKSNNPFTDLVACTSTDDGLTWGAPVTVMTNVGIATQGNELVVSNTGRWLATCLNGSELKASTSSDNGATWTTPVTVTFTQNYDLDCDGDKFIAIHGSNTLHTITSTDGVNWTDAGTTFGQNPVGQPRLAVVSKDHLLTLYRPNGTSVWHCTESTDAGVSWSNPVIAQTFADGNPYIESFATDGYGRCFATWMELTATGESVYTIESQDNGATWGAPVSVSDIEIHPVPPHSAITTDRQGHWVVCSLYVEGAYPTPQGVRYSYLNADNEAPSAVPLSFGINEDTSHSDRLSASDGDGDTLTFFVERPPTHGALTAFNPDGSFTYAPDANYSGDDSFTFRATDAKSQSRYATVAITLSAVNDSPIATDDSLSTNEDTAGLVTLSGSDADGDTLTFAIDMPPSHGTVTLNGADATYTPDPDYDGPDSFTFVANDGTVDSAPATISITANAVNDAPVATAASFSTNKNTAKTFTLPASDVDGDSLNYVIVTPPSHGTVGTTGAAATYVPALNFHGVDTFKFKVTDASSSSAPATITINVGAPNNPPTVAISASPLTLNEGSSVSFSIIASDPDGDALSSSWNFGDGQNAAGSPQTHIFAAAGTYTVTVTVQDGNGGSASANVSITVQTAPPPPPPPSDSPPPDGSPSNPSNPVGGSPLFSIVMKGKANLATAGKDSASVTALLPAMPGFQPLGKTLSVNAGGAQASFTLDKRGKGRGANGTIQLKPPRSAPKSDPFSAGPISLKISLKNGDWSQGWGLKGGAMPSSLVIFVEIDGVIYAGTITTQPKITPGKNATFTAQ